MSVQAKISAEIVDDSGSRPDVRQGLNAFSVQDQGVNIDSGASVPRHLTASAISLPYQPRAREIRARISRNAGIVLIAVGLVVAIGWLAGLKTVTQLVPGWASMSFNTALSFVLLGITFVLPGGAKDSPTPRLIGRATAAAAGLLTLASLLDFSFSLNLNIDQIFVDMRSAAPNGSPAQMSAASACGLLLTAVAALLVSWRTRDGFRPSLVLGVIVAAIALLGLIGHIYDAQSLYKVKFFAGMSIYTSLLLFAAAVGILGVHPDKGPLGVLAAAGRGSRLARTLLPFGIAIPVLIGWARLEGERAGLYEFEFGLALFATASVLTFIVLIWLTATSLNREDILRRRADEAMEHETIRRRILFEKAKDGIMVLGADQRVVEANSSFAEMIGYPQSAVVTLHPWDWIVDTKTRERVVSDWANLAEDGATFEAQLRRRDGKIIDAEVSCTTARFDAQQFLFFVCRDITQRKQSQHALHASEQRFRRALANIPDVVVIYDVDLRIQYINNATRLVTGQSPDFFIGKRDEEVFPAEVCEVYLPTLRKAFLTKQICALEADVNLPDAGTRSLRITCVPLMDQDGNVREVLGVTRDLTDSKEAESTIRTSESKFRQLIEQAATGIVISNRDGKVELVNSRCCELLGYEEKELLGFDLSLVLGATKDDSDGPDMRALSPGDELHFERQLRRADGTLFPSEVSVNVLESGARQVLFQDITVRFLQEQKIGRLNRIQAVMGSINSAIVRLRNRQELLQETCRVAVDEGHFCVGWVGVIDHENGELQMVAEAGLDQDADQFVNQSIRLVAEGPTEFAVFQQKPVFDNDIERSANASPIRASASRRGARSVISLPLVVEGETFGVVVLYATERNFFDDEELNLLRQLAKDVSFGLEFIAKEEKVDFLAYYDTLTGLPNRNLFFHRLARQLQDSTEQNLRTVLSVVDVDRFRVINETYGRHEGDAVIAEVAARIREAFDEHSTVARIGSNAIAIAVTGTLDATDTGHRLEELNSAVFDAAFRVGDDDVRVQATIGIAVFPEDGDSPETLLGNAEAALRNARSRNIRFLLYSKDMNERVAESMRLENKVRAALENEEFTLWYQPKVCAQTGELRGMEALMRWKDSESGDMVPPDLFIPVMEHTGLILEAGRWAMRQVANDCLRWQEQGVLPPRVAVNVSPIQLQQQDFVGNLIEAQIVAKEAGSAIDVEITESVIMDDVDSIIPKLQTLHSVGTRVHVDDFGTGYSSLAYIAKLPIDALKIDRSFVADMRPGSEGLAIVRSIISLAKATRLQVIAEGVETAEQVEMLRELECDELQGYHLGRPLPPDEALEVIRKLGENTSA